MFNGGETPTETLPLLVPLSSISVPASKSNACVFISMPPAADTFR